jgi:hypothetical protein
MSDSHRLLEVRNSLLKWHYGGWGTGSIYPKRRKSGATDALAGRHPLPGTAGECLPVGRPIRRRRKED